MVTTTSETVPAGFCEHVISVALQGRTLAAADAVLVWPGSLAALESTMAALSESVVTAFDRGDATGRERLTHLLLRVAMNLVGYEMVALEVPAESAKAAAETVKAALTACEKCSASVVRETVAKVLADMASVNSGDSLPGLLAEEIAPQVKAAEPTGQTAAAFVSGFATAADRCVYSVMARTRMAKFGNDYARGLEYLRHLGYVQVSTNPVLAAKAFDEDPGLVGALRAEVAANAAWRIDPKAHGDAVALQATLIALWPNLEVFRPLALLAANTDYMVSFQLNPNIADRAEESLSDARRAFELARAHLAEYDRALGVPQPGHRPPCMVFKVAGSHKACRTITTALNAEGIGTNNTVVYSVGQECQLILDAWAGKAAAIKAAKPVGRTYQTNMGGRLASHLREVQAERLVARAESLAGREVVAAALVGLAEGLKVDANLRAGLSLKSLADQAQALCAFRFLKRLDHPAFATVGQSAGQSAEQLATLEADIRKTGTLVARRVWGLFFAPDHRPLWQTWLAAKYQLTAQQAIIVHESMDVLPASKRVIDDTLHALGYPNMCHTEFPNHSRAVELAARDADFRLADYADSISAQYPPEVATRLAEALPEFAAAYELPAHLADLMVHEVGLAQAAATCGRGGLLDNDWPHFGPVIKTGAEFRGAYDQFVARCISWASEASPQKP